MKPRVCSPKPVNWRPISWTGCIALQDLGVVADVRGFGLLAGIEVKPGKAPGARGTELQGRLFDRGLHVKNTGDVLILAPPFIASRAELDQIAAILRDALAEYRLGAGSSLFCNRGYLALAACVGTAE